MSISSQLPETIREFVETQAAEDGFASPDEYVLDLLRSEQKRQARARLQTAIEQGLQSGPPKPVTPEFWMRLRQELDERTPASGEE